MKRTIFILAAILVSVYVVLSLLGSRGEYASERIFYRALKAKAKIAANPDVVPPVLFASAEKDLRRILEKYPETNTAKAARMTLVELYILNKGYDKAIYLLDEVINRPDEDKALLSKAHFIKGNIYEKQNRQGEALEEYRVLQRKYADTPLGVQIPLYIGDYYARSGQEIKANKAYNEAIIFYEKLGEEKKGGAFGYMASSLLLQAYMNLKDYKEAGRVIDGLINNYPSTFTYLQHLPKVDFIFVKSLKNPAKAIEIYKSVREKTGDDRLKRFLDERIAALEAAK